MGPVGTGPVIFFAPRNPVAVQHPIMPYAFFHLLLFIFCCAANSTRAQTYPLPENDTLIGQAKIVTLSDSRNSLLDVARHYDLGLEEIERANPDVSLWVPKENERIVIPTEFILPPKPWKGIVINIPQRRVFYFPESGKNKARVVMTFPVSIAQPGWKTPLGETRIKDKERNPTWEVPKEIQKERIEAGELDHPAFFEPGPDNPMGLHAIETGFKGIYLHGTNKPWGIGTRSSHGCLRMYPEDAALLFEAVPRATPIRIIDEPVIMGKKGGELYLSTFEPIPEYEGEELEARVKKLLVPRMGKKSDQEKMSETLEWKRMQTLLQTPHPFPAPISKDERTQEERLSALPVEAYDFEPYSIEANNASLPPPKKSVVAETPPLPNPTGQ